MFGNTLKGNRTMIAAIETFTHAWGMTLGVLTGAGIFAAACLWMFWEDRDDG